MTRVPICTLLVMTTLVPGLEAGSPKTTRLWVDVRAPRKVYIDDATTGTTLGDVYYRTVHADETTEIVVRNANPLVFKYTFDVTTTPSESAAAIEPFANAFSELLARFGNKAAGQATPVIEGLDFGKFQNQITATFTNVESIRGWIDMSLNPARLSDLKDGIRPLPTSVDQTAASYAKALQIHLKCMRGDPLSTDAGPVACTAPLNLAPVIAERQSASAFGLATARLEQARSGVATVIAADQAVAIARARVDADQKAVDSAPAAHRDELRRSLAKSKAAKQAAEANLAAVKAPLASAYAEYQTLKSARDAAETAWQSAKAEVAKAEASAAANQTTIASFLRDVMSIQVQVEKAGILLKQFASDASDVGTDKTTKSIAYSLDTTTVTINVEPENKYADYLSAAAKDAQKAVKDVKIVVQPYRVATVRPGVAFVLGLLRNPDYSTVKAGDKFRITEKGTELTRFNVAAMINVIPRGWDEPTFGGFFQFGVSPKNDETAFFLGWGLQLESVITFGAGVMVQQVRRLDSSQHVNDLLDSPDDLKVSKPFKKSVYVHATVALAKKKS